MKITKKRVLFFILHVLFSALVPISLVIARYSTIGNTKEAIGFKISVTGIMLLIFVFWMIKRLFIDKRLRDLNEQGNVLIAGLKTETDPAKLANIEKAIKGVRTVEAVFDSVIPLLFIAAGVIAFRAMEAQLIKLSATLGFIAISYVIGALFNVLYAREVHHK